MLITTSTRLLALQRLASTIWPSILWNSCMKCCKIFNVCLTLLYTQGIVGLSLCIFCFMQDAAVDFWKQIFVSWLLQDSFACGDIISYNIIFAASVSGICQYSRRCWQGNNHITAILYLWYPLLSTESSLLNSNVLLCSMLICKFAWTFDICTTYLQRWRTIT